MCIENINANILCYRKRDYYSDKDLIENLEYKTTKKGKYIDDIELKFYFNFMSTSDKIKSQYNVLMNSGELECKLYLVKIPRSEESGANNDEKISVLRKPIVDFVIDLSDDVMNYSNKIINLEIISPIFLPKGEEVGEYLFELWVKRKMKNYEDDKFTKQSIYGINIIDPNSVSKV